MFTHYILHSITHSNPILLWYLICNITFIFAVELALDYTFESYFTLICNFTSVYAADLTFDFTLKSYFTLICNFTFIYKVNWTLNYPFKSYFTLIFDMQLHIHSWSRFDIWFDIQVLFLLWYVISQSFMQQIWHSITHSTPILLWYLKSHFTFIFAVNFTLDCTFKSYFAKLSSSSVPVQSNLNWDLALNLVITTHPSTPPEKVEIQPLLYFLGSWKLAWKLYSTQIGQLANHLTTS